MNRLSNDNKLRSDFLEFVLSSEVLTFGKFITKAGRESPYFFNTGKFSNGKLLKSVAEYYARKIISINKTLNLEIDCLFGPAYKGIPLVSAIAIVLESYSFNVDIVFDRKEAKTHGEKGSIIGNIGKKNVLIIDDVISAGLSSKKAIDLIKKENGHVLGILVALDRKEKSTTQSVNLFKNAAEEISSTTGIPIFSLANLFELRDYMEEKRLDIKPIDKYLQIYGSTE